MGLFVREKLIYKERGKKEEWKRAQALLKEAGLKLSVTELPGEAPICGCGAKLDWSPRQDRPQFLLYRCA